MTWPMAPAEGTHDHSDEPPDATATTAPTLRARADAADCGCLACRGLSPIAAARSILDALVWSARLVRSSPSILAFGLGIILLNRLLESGITTALPLPVVGLAEGVAGVAFAVILRAHVATIAAGEMTGTPLTARSALAHACRRLPALLAVYGLIVALVMAVSTVLLAPIVFAAVALLGDPVARFGVLPVALVGGTLFAIPFVVVLIKTWVAPEACVVGRYGPIQSLRVSWRVTSIHGRRVALVVGFGVASAGALFVLGSTPGLAGSLGAAGPLLGPIAASLGELLSIVWMGVYAHLYVQGIVDL